MKKSIQSIAIALLAGVSTSMIVAAAEIPSRGPIPFEVFDNDANGAISEQEFLQAHAERQAMREAQGRPTRAQPAAQLFYEFDIDQDGYLSPDELSAGQMAQRQGRSGLPPGQSGGMGMGRNMPTFTEFDLNQDGVLTEDEFNEARGRRISERAMQGYQMRGLQHARPYSDIDTDGNGEVTPEEFAAAQALHRQQRQNWQDQQHQ